MDRDSTRRRSRPAHSRVTNFQDLFSSNSSSGAGASGNVDEPVTSANQTTQDPHNFTIYTSSGAVRSGNPNYDFQPHEPLGLHGDVLDSAPSANQITADPYNRNSFINTSLGFGLEQSIHDLQLHETRGLLDGQSLAPATGGGSELNPPPWSRSGNPNSDPRLHEPLGSFGNILDSLPSVDQIRADPYNRDYFIGTSSGLGLGNPTRESQRNENLGLLDGQSLSLATVGGSGLNSAATNLSGRISQGIGASAGAIPSHGRVGTGNPYLHSNVGRGGEIHALTDNAVGVSERIYDPDPVRTLRPIRVVRQHPVRPLQPQNVNYGQPHSMANSRTSVFNNQGRLLGFVHHARPRPPSQFSYNIHGNAQVASHEMPRYNVQTASHGPPRYNNAQSSCYFFSHSPWAITSRPRFPGAAAVRGQNQLVQMGQPRGNLQVQPQQNLSGYISPGQPPAGFSTYEPSASSNVQSSLRKRPAQDHPPVDIALNRRRAEHPPPLPFPSFQIDDVPTNQAQVVPSLPFTQFQIDDIPPNQALNRRRAEGPPPLPFPLFQIDDIPPNQAQVGPSLSRSRPAAAAFPIQAQSAWPFEPNFLRRTSRPLTAQAPSYVPLAQRYSADATFQQSIAQGSPVSSSSSCAPWRDSPPSPLPPASSFDNRIRWEGEEHQLVGSKCIWCKRDLSHPPEGPIIENPELLPVVSVLPCGHSFHYQCLEKITPPGQADNPPCETCDLEEEKRRLLRHS